MKTYFLFLGQQIGYKHPAPERTTKESPADWLNKPDKFRIWPNRASMARAIRMQERNNPCANLRPLVPLKDGEGF